MDEKESKIKDYNNELYKLKRDKSNLLNERERLLNEIKCKEDAYRMIVVEKNNIINGISATKSVFSNKKTSFVNTGILKNACEYISQEFAKESNKQDILITGRIKSARGIIDSLYNRLNEIDNRIKIIDNQTYKINRNIYLLREE